MLNWICPPAFAHGLSATPSDQIPPNVWWEWRFEGGVFIALLLMLGLYFYGIKYCRETLNIQTPLPRRQPVYFMLGLASIYIAIASPIDAIGELYLFSMHMVQHNIFIYLTPWLLFAGIPDWLLAPAYERLHPWGKIALKWLMHPIPACLIFNLTFAGWHFPYLYEWALQDRMMHNLEHVTFIGASLLMWLPVWSPLYRIRLSHVKQALYILALTIAQIPIFAFITFSKSVFYETYALAPRLTRLTPIGDQQMGGIIMKLVAMLVMSWALIGVFMAWYKAEQEEDALSVASTPRQARQPV